MCGRFTLTVSQADVASLFQGLRFTFSGFEPRYNIAPTQPVVCVRKTDEDLTGDLLRWGLVPSWAKDLKIGSRMINARSETVASKPAFRAAFKKRRCLVLADGFYEWKKVGSVKQPYYIRVHQALFCMAGLWESWQNPSSGTTVETCTVLTTESNEAIRGLHDRMPVILDEDQFEMWLDPEFLDRQRLEEFLVPYPSDAITMYPVSRNVNKPSNDSAQCVEPIAENGTLFE